MVNYEAHKVEFNPANRKHLRAFKRFLENSGWGSSGCPFLIQYPHRNVVDMIQSRIAEHVCSKIK